MYIDNSDPSENVGQIHFSLEYDFQNTTLILKVIQVRSREKIIKKNPRICIHNLHKLEMQMRENKYFSINFINDVLHVFYALCCFLSYVRCLMLLLKH